jgi:hypothetical protein
MGDAAHTANSPHSAKPARGGLGAATLRRDVVDNLICLQARYPAIDTAHTRSRRSRYRLGGKERGEPALHMPLNMYDSARTVELPAPEGRCWRRIVDTARDSPLDIVHPAQRAGIESDH